MLAGRHAVMTGSHAGQRRAGNAERAALALAEAETRISDRPNPVSDEVWGDAARQYDDPALAAPVVAIATISTWNRLNVTTRQVAGGWTATATGGDREPALVSSR